jgi:hypothetical protein
MSRTWRKQGWMLAFAMATSAAGWEALAFALPWPMIARIPFVATALLFAGLCGSTLQILSEEK